MVQRLIILTRTLIYLVTATSLIALGISAAYPRSGPTAPVWRARWDSVKLQNSPDQPRVEERCYLIDRESGRCEVLSLPQGNRWGPLSVSPWCDADGNSEAVGPCYSLTSTADGHLFWGLARLRFPEGSVIEKVQLDILPTGRPCWLHQRPGEILFAAGDGKLYRHDFRQDDGPDCAGEGFSSTRMNTSIPRPVAWRCTPPGNRSLFIEDPVWPGDPRLRHLLFAAATPQLYRGEPASTNVPQIWWFMMNEDGTSIEGAGRLIEPGTPGTQAEGTARRFPNIGVDRDGTIHLVYLSRIRGKRALRLEAVQIEVDAASRQPKVSPGSRPVVLDTDSALIPPLVSADGHSVIGISRSTGQLIRHRIDDAKDLQDRIALAIED